MIRRTWDVVRLGEHCTKIGSGATPRGGEAVYQDTGVAFIRSQNVYNGRFAVAGLAHIDDEHADMLKGVAVESGDVLLNITGDSVARSCRVPNDVLPARVNQHVAIIRPKRETLDPRFVGYYLISPFMQDTMLSLAGSGGTRKALTKEMIERFEVPRPLLPIQERIADILSAYDDLIENNRRRMALLEEAARQVYREWFVRFRFPGYEHTRIINGVPEGWERKRIGDVADCVGGGTPSTAVPQYWEDGNIAWVTPTDVTQNAHFALLDSVKKITEAGLQSSSAKLVPSHAILMTSRASVGFFAVAGREVCTNQGFIAVVPHEPLHWPYFLFHLSERVEEIRVMGSGSTYPEVSRGKFREFNVLLPTHTMTTAFCEHAALHFRQIRILKQQNVRLRAARDLLLPRLMSGEIAV